MRSHELLSLLLNGMSSIESKSMFANADHLRLCFRNGDTFPAKIRFALANELLLECVHPFFRSYYVDGATINSKLKFHCFIFLCVRWMSAKNILIENKHSIDRNIYILCVNSHIYIFIMRPALNTALSDTKEHSELYSEFK